MKAQGSLRLPRGWGALPHIRSDCAGQRIGTQMVSADFDQLDFLEIQPIQQTGLF